MIDNDGAQEVVIATFFLDNNIHLALDTVQVREAIIIETDIVPLPSSLNFIEGMMNLRGAVVPVVNLKKRLGLASTEYQGVRKAAIVELQHTAIGILFDGVKDVIRVARSDVKTIDASIQGQDKIIHGVINHCATDRIIELIDPSHLVSADQARALGRSVDQTSLAPQTPAARSVTTKYVVFSWGQQEYGIDIKYVREVETVKTSKVETAFQGNLICGSIMVHGKNLPLIKMGSICQQHPLENEEGLPPEQNIVVLDVSNNSFAATIDSVKEIATVNEDQVLRTSMIPDGAAKGIFQPSENRNIVLLDPQVAFAEHLADIESFNILHDKNEQYDGYAGEQDKRNKYVTNENSYLVFSAGRAFAMDLHFIQEILPNATIISTPDTSNYLKGIVNLRGALVPVLDLREFLGFERDESSVDLHNLIIVTIDTHRLALTVDTVSTVARQEGQTKVPSLDERLEQKRDIFENLVTIKNKAGELEHTLVIDPRRLLDHIAFTKKTTVREEA